MLKIHKKCYILFNISNTENSKIREKKYILLLLKQSYFECQKRKKIYFSIFIICFLVSCMQPWKTAISRIISNELAPITFWPVINYVITWIRCKKRKNRKRRFGDLVKTLNWLGILTDEYIYISYSLFIPQTCVINFVIHAYWWFFI